MEIETGTIRVPGSPKPISCTWDMSAELNDAQAAGCYAKLFLPIAQGQDGFFEHAARELLQGILVVLIRRRKRWGLRELIDITSDVQLLRKTLALDTDTNKLFERYSQTPMTLLNILVTLNVAMRNLEPDPVEADSVPPGAAGSELKKTCLSAGV